jgi:hypothetical protein
MLVRSLNGVRSCDEASLATNLFFIFQIAKAKPTLNKIFQMMRGPLEWLE